MSAQPDHPQRPVLSLRPIELADAGRVHEWASDERACRYQTWGPNTRDETEDFVAEAVRASHQPDGARQVWAATSPDLDVVGIGEVKRVTRTCAEIAYAVHVEQWGRGFATQLARLLLEVAFVDPAIARVQGTCDPRNLASAAVLRKAGLLYEGTMRHTAHLRDGWRDSAMHAVLRGEWSA
ncbi:GNAT family N-acetyltransferase [Nocardioides alpinus]|uniref:GNAT family N-acetyltransferase n=1 Tax=Nocardioides alpinus TaxID=748909 RepID=UPI001E3DDA5A|nr:GNAT family protein [Nocardioides alpinus]